MKRQILRIAASAVVLALGCIALAQANRDDRSPDPAEDASSVRQADVDSQDAAARASRPSWSDRRPATSPVRQVSHEVFLSPLPSNSASSASSSNGPTPDPFGLDEPPVRPARSASPNSVSNTRDDSSVAPAAWVNEEPGALELSGPRRPLSPPPAPAAEGSAVGGSGGNELDALSTTMPGRAAASGRSPAPLGATSLPPINPPNFSNPAAPPARLQPMPAAPGFVDAAADAPPEPTGTGTPATDRRLEGLQSPQLTIQKYAPKELQVGRPAIFRVKVRNTGVAVARGVEVRDRVPKGTRLIETKPQASPGTRGDLVWSLQEMQPGAEAIVEMIILPLSEGEIGSVATVHLQAEASVRTFATRPELAVDVTCPKQVMIDEDVELTITVSNVGSGVASGVVLEERVPPGLQHPAGAELEYPIGKLGPKQSQTLKLKLTAVRAGEMLNQLIARAQGLPDVKREIPMAVVAPALKLAMDGPESRYLERRATYKLSVSNAGSANAKDVRLEARLPRGLKFVSANNNGHFDPQSHTVRWALAELPVNETGTVELTALPVEIGTQKLTFRTVAKKALAVEQSRPVVVDGLAAIRYEVVDVDDPIEIGGHTTYEIRVQNQGSKDATNVQVAIDLPAGMTPVAAEGPDGVRHTVQGNQVVFASLPRLGPKVSTTYRLRVEARDAGDQRVRVQLQTAEIQTPVVKEESTRVFSDK